MCVFVHWRDTPNLVGPYGSAITTDGIPIGVTELNDGVVAANGARAIQINSIVPRVVTNTADATISVVMCTAPPLGGVRLGGGTVAQNGRELVARPWLHSTAGATRWRTRPAGSSCCFR